MDCTPLAARWAFRCVRNRRLLAITCAESLPSCVPVTSLSRTLKVCRGVHLHGVELTAVAVQCQDHMLHTSGTIIQTTSIVGLFRREKPGHSAAMPDA
jgi:hypothetical protein